MRKISFSFQYGGFTYSKTPQGYFSAPDGNTPFPISKNAYYRAKTLATIRPNPLNHSTAKTEVLPVAWTVRVKGAPLVSAKTITMVDGLYFVSGVKHSFPSLNQAVAFARAAARCKHQKSKKVWA